MKKIILGIWMLLIAPLVVLVGTAPAYSQFSDSHHLLNAIENNDMSVAKERLSNGASPNARRPDNPGLLICANGTPHGCYYKHPIANTYLFNIGPCSPLLSRTTRVTSYSNLKVTSCP